MENIECLLFGPLCGMLLLLVLAAMVKHLLEYSANVRRVKTEIHRACDWKEYVYWKKELRNLSLIHI